MRGIVGLVIGIILTAGCWYLFVKPYEYQVNFKVTTTQGDAIETLRIWNRTLKGCEILGVDSLQSLTQTMNSEGGDYMFKWNFIWVNDSTTQVKVEISEPGNAIKNKLLIAFQDLPIEKGARKFTKEFYNVLQEHLKITNVQIIGETELESVFCACRTVETEQTNKAQGMMINYGFLADFIGDQNLAVNGLPLVRLLEWNHSQGKIKYDFCFPIIKNDSLKDNQYITFKEIDRMKAIKAVYNGNYITSDRAWYSLHNYAQSNSLKVDGLPIEYFYNNPNVGVNEKEWKAEIYLPIQ
ncbi:MAG: GyrI-like domain-containing protein [Fulvivirga sp.]